MCLNRNLFAFLRGLLQAALKKYVAQVEQVAGPVVAAWGTADTDFKGNVPFVGEPFVGVCMHCAHSFQVKKATGSCRTP